MSKKNFFDEDEDVGFNGFVVAAVAIAAVLAVVYCIAVTVL